MLTATLTVTVFITCNCNNLLQCYNVTILCNCNCISWNCDFSHFILNNCNLIFYNCDVINHVILFLVILTITSIFLIIVTLYFTMWPNYVAVYIITLTKNFNRNFLSHCVINCNFHVIVISQLQMTSIERWCSRDGGIWSHLPAGFGRNLKGCLERTSLLRVEDCTWSLGSSWVFPIISLPSASWALLRLDIQLLIFTFLWKESHHSQESVLTFKTLQLFRQPTDK